MTDFSVIYEQATDGSWSARAVDLPVYAVGDSRSQAEREIRDAIGVHLAVLHERSADPPLSRSVTGSVSV